MEEMHKFEVDNGYIIFQRRGANTVELVDIACRQHRRGTGRALVEAVHKHLEHERPYYFYAITESQNSNARKFYEALGMDHVATLENFYIHKSTRKRTDQTVTYRDHGIMYGKEITR